LLFGPKDFPALTIEMELEMEKVKVNVKEKGKPQTRGFFFFLFSFFFSLPHYPSLGQAWIGAFKNQYLGIGTATKSDLRNRVPILTLPCQFWEG
jgi:hypothetical protein